MADFFDYDPITGIRTDYEYDELTGDATLHRTQDVSSLLDFTKGLANDSATDGGIKKGWWLYCKIPPIVELQLRAKGIKLSDRGATDRIMAEINANYPHLKCTQKSAGEKLKDIYLG